MQPRNRAYIKKKKSNRGRKSIDPKDKKIRVDGGYKDPTQVKKLGGIEKVRELLSTTFDAAINK